MFKTIPIVVMATLCLNFSTKAQENKAVDITSKGIQIGQRVPDITITNLHNYKGKNGKPATTAKLSDFKGKLLILDFWATWCSPCVAMIPKMDSLQKAFGDKIQFLSVTYQNEKDVLQFLEKFETQKGQHYDLPVITDSKELHKLFPHVYLPHYVWIDGNGIVRAITEFREVSTDDIQEILREPGAGMGFKQKKDMKVTYDYNFPLFINGNGGNTNKLIFHSLLTGYSSGMASEYHIGKSDKIDGRRFVFTNENLINLLGFAFGEGKNWFQKNRIKIDVSDPATLVFKSSKLDAKEWIKQNQYCYEITVPVNMEQNIHKIMQEDLIRLFPQYKVSVQQIKQKCTVLERTSEIDKISFKGGNEISEFNGTGFNLNGYYLSRLISQLNFIYMQKSTYPIIDNTGYADKISIRGDADLAKIESINDALKKYDLTFSIKDMLIDVLVIEDKNSK